MMARVVSLLITGLFVSSSAAQLRLFLATNGTSSSQPLMESPALENPQISSGDVLYIYAQMFAGPQAWNGVSLNIKINGGGTIDSFDFYEYANAGFLRWDFAGSGSLGQNNPLLSNAYGLAHPDGFGVQNDPQFDDLDLHYRRDVDATLLGWIRILMPGSASDAEIFLGVGNFGITLAGTSLPQNIYLGFGDETDGLTGDSLNQYSSLADATVTKHCDDYSVADTNCDGTINALDIDPFVQALTDPQAYAAEHPDCHRLCTCDTNQDGQINSLDIDTFVECITVGCPQ